jgi:hypothetical protein
MLEFITEVFWFIVTNIIMISAVYLTGVIVVATVKLATQPKEDADNQIKRELLIFLVAYSRGYAKAQEDGLKGDEEAKEVS